MSWARDGSDLVTWFTGREQLSELWRNHMHAIKCVTTCKPSLAQLNLDSPQHALSNGYRVWGVIMHLGYEGKRSSSGFFRRTAGAAHGDVPLVGSFSSPPAPFLSLSFCAARHVLRAHRRRALCHQGELLNEPVWSHRRRDLLRSAYRERSKLSAFFLLLVRR